MEARMSILKNINLRLGAALAIAALFFGMSFAQAAESDFLRQFKQVKSEHRFEALVFLVKQNKKIIPGEINSLVKEAMSGDKTNDEKIEILGLAEDMAAMYKEWHGDGKPLAEVDEVLNRVIADENAKLAEIEKWARYEKLTGNSLMRTNRKEMDAKGVAPVIFPHWVHRLWFECKTCHPAVFPIKRGPVTHAEMDGGGKCGRCHNGSAAFSAKGECERCHIVGKPEEERLLSPAKADLGKLKGVATRLGSGLSASKLPLDRFGSIDWNDLRKTKSFSPLKSLDKGGQGETRENMILFDVPVAGMKNVVFDHGTHSAAITCTTCHQEPFKDKLGANAITMNDMAAGGWCGYCHGKVAFRFAECNRCHVKPQDEKAEGLLRRK
jgi:c(7)-type cytochrome triheme protein